jgi:hypothetical protein
MAKSIFGTLSLKAGTANTVVYLDASKDLVSSAVTDTELGYLDGVTSALQTQLDAKEPTITATTSTDYYRGDKTFATLDTDAVTEGTALYYTDERAQDAIGSILLDGGGLSWTYDDGTPNISAAIDITGQSAPAGGISGTDEVLIYDVSGTALAKVTAQDIADLAGNHPVGVFKDTWATGDTATKAITHSLGTTDVIVQVFDIATGESIIVDTVDRTDANTVTVTASEAPPAGSWRVLILSL